MHPDYQHIGPWLFAALAAFALYRRFRRNFGRQALRPVRMSVRIAILSVIGVLLLPAALRSTELLLAAAAGAALGLGLGVWAARRTRFERHDGELHYVPHTSTGIVVFALFVGRIIYRLAHMASSGYFAGAADAGHPGASVRPDSMVQSPITLGLFFLLIGYYVYYYGRLLWKSKHLTAEDIEMSASVT
jgi:hypothetical protein